MRKLIAILFMLVPLLFLTIFYVDGGLFGIFIGLMYTLAMLGILYCPLIGYRIWTKTENKL